MPCETADGTNKTKPSPAYQRIEEDIRAKVRGGQLPAGTMLASRHNLAREYGVALSTAQQAVARLIADGTLETSDRRGTFVARPQAPAGEQLPETPAHRQRATGQIGATLGIVSTARIDFSAAPDVGSLWARLAVRSLEQVFSGAGGTTHFFDRYPADRGPYPRGLDDTSAVSIPEAIRSLQAGGADAIAVIGLCDAKDSSDEVVSAVDVAHVPTVYISWHEIPPPLAQVFYDNRFAGYQAAQHLLFKGYRRLVFLAPFADGWLAERIGGARDAVRHAGLPYDTLRLHPGGRPIEFYDQYASGDAVCAMALALFAGALGGGDAGEPVGIIAPNDETAYAVLGAAAQLGLTAGTGFGLIGFDDDARSCALGLTTIRPPVEAMGEEAGRLLLRALYENKTGLQMRLRSHLIPRASTLLNPIPLSPIAVSEGRA